MKVTYYDLLSHIIPGAFIIVFIQLFAIRPTMVHPSLVFTADSILLFTPIIFVIGFLISSLSNLLEILLDKVRCINPENYMLSKKAARFFHFYELQRVFNYLDSNLEICHFMLIKNNKQAIYTVLRRIAYTNGDLSKINNFKAQTSFARNIFLVFVLCFIASLFEDYFIQSYILKVFLLVAVILSLYRYVWRRAAYIAEIFNKVISSND